MRRLTTEEFIQKARAVHGDRYDYSRVVYRNARTKVEIVCPEHGSFWQLPGNHLKGCKCPFCVGNFRLEVGEFIRRAREVHGERYDYSRVSYRNNKTRVEFICPQHGSFWNTPKNHLNGQGCPVCAGKGKLDVEEFVRRAREIHGDRYDYSRVVYRNNGTKVEIVCPEHGSFWQIPSAHLKGQGCSSCSGNRRMGTKEFIRRAREVHGDVYDYSRVEYRNNRTKVEIVCPTHGSFWQSPGAHLRGQGCPVCGNRFPLDTELFIQKAREVHGDKYDYSRVNYKGFSEKVEIVCPKHGSFWQLPVNHTSLGNGCPRCINHISRAEQELADTIKSWGYDIVQSYRKWCPERPGLEIDIYIPKLMVGIEFNGDYWHSLKPEGYHEDKLRFAVNSGISLVMVWESEWVENREGVLSFVREFLEEKEKCVV